MKFGQKIGLTDQLLRDICVGDVVKDAKGVEYSVDKYGRAKPLNGGNEVPIRSLTGCEVVSELPGNDASSAPFPDIVVLGEEEQTLADIRKYTALAGDQTLVDELRDRGWTVVCTKVVEKTIYEEVKL